MFQPAATNQPARARRDDQRDSQDPGTRGKKSTPATTSSSQPDQTEDSQLHVQPLQAEQRHAHLLPARADLACGDGGAEL